MSSSSPNAKPKKLFVVGMHRSGTSILADLLKAHPSISGHEIAEMPPELENEGQHVQRVFPPDDALGGPGFFAFNPLAHLTEDAAQPEHAAQLEGEWGLHWQSDARCVLEKSPSSILRTRYLQALFPDAYFLVILRHPICTAYATHAWGLQHGGKNSLASDAVVGFVEHWLAAHEILQADLEHLRQVRVVHLEQLTESPQAVVDRCRNCIKMWKTVLSLIWNNVRVLVLGHNRCHDTPSSGQEVRSSPGPRWAPENRAPGDLSVNPSVDVTRSGQGKE